MGQDRYYLRELIKWYELYFYSNGQPKENIDWSKMIIQEPQYISTAINKTILLMEK